MKPVAETWFLHQKITENLYLVYEPYYYERSRVNIWVIKGKKCILVIDTGLGVAPLYTYIQEQIDGTRPIKAVATDIHFDHTGGMHEFKNCCIHKSEVLALSFADQSHILSTSEYGYVSDDEFTKYPFSEFSAEKYSVKAAPHVRPLKHGDEISAGNMCVEVIHLPGHSRGAIALYDHDNRWLFCGDVVYDGNLLDDLPGSDVKSYVKSMETLLALDPARVYPGHFQPLDALEMHRIAEQYIFQNSG